LDATASGEEGVHHVISVGGLVHPSSILNLKLRIQENMRLAMVKGKTSCLWNTLMAVSSELAISERLLCA